MKKHVFTAVLILIGAAFLLAFTGCTQIERDGLSPIPQNSPGSWEMNPYGAAFHN